MAEKMFIKPSSEDLLVRDPETFLPLDKDGEEKPRTQFWNRRLRDGDVVLTQKPKKPKEKKEASK